MTEQYKTLLSSIMLGEHQAISDAPLDESQCSFKITGQAGRQSLTIQAANREEIRMDAHASFHAHNEQDVYSLGQVYVPSDEENLLSQQRLLCKQAGAKLEIAPIYPSNLYKVPIVDTLFHFKPIFFLASTEGLHFADQSKKALSDYELARHFLFASCFGEGLLCLASSQKLIPLNVTGRFSLPMASIAAFSQKVRLIPEALEIGEGPADLTCAVIGSGQVWVTADALSLAEVESLYEARSI